MSPAILLLERVRCAFSDQFAMIHDGEAVHSTSASSR